MHHMRKASEGRYFRMAALLLLFSSMAILLVKNYQLFANDPLWVASDISTHATRPYFYLKNPGFVAEWYNGTPLFNYYPPASIWLSTLFFILTGSPGLATSLAMLAAEALVLLFCVLLARELKVGWKRGALAGLLVLASSISVGRFFNAGRYGEFLGFALLLGWGVLMLAYWRKPSNANMAGILALAFFTMLSHFLEALMLLAAAGALALFYVANKDGKISKILSATAVGAVPSAAFWVPFILDSDKPAIAGTAASGYWTLVGGLLLLFAFAVFFIRYRSVAAYALAFVLVAWGAGKVLYYPPLFPEDFEGLRMDGKYVATDGVHATAYSVLALKGFRSSWGNYDPAAGRGLDEAYQKMNPEDCGTLQEYSRATGTKYFIVGSAELERCGFKLAYSNVYKVYREGE